MHQTVESPSVVSQRLAVDQQVMDQFTRMKTMLSSFLWPMEKEITRTAFCNYLASEVEASEDGDFKHSKTRL